MKPFKIKEAYFDAESGESRVTLFTDMGEITQKAKLHPDDCDAPSQYFGCRIAEKRCVVKYCKRRAAQAMAEYHTLETFYRNMRDTRNYNPSDFYVTQLIIQMSDKKGHAEMWKKRAATVAAEIQVDIATRDAMLKQKGGKE